jgi:hypothetical protein
MSGIFWLTLEITRKLQKINYFRSVADPDPGSGAILTLGSGIRDGEKVRIRTRDEHSESYFQKLKHHFIGLKNLNSLMRIRDGEKSDPE